MSHTYASVVDLKDYIVDNGGSALGVTLDDELLLHLEGASRRVDAYCGRSQYDSGFGPRQGTNRYDDPGGATLWLDDDLLSITTLTTYATVGGSGTTLADDNTKYLKQPYQPTPYRSLRIHADSSASWDQLVDVSGKWGYQDEQVGGLTMGTVSASTTSATLSAGSAYAGQTLLNGSEQLYVTASTGGTALTVVRGVNGTTAAVHADASAVTRYRYPREVQQATILVAFRRWRNRDAGLSGDYGGGPIPVTTQRDSERAILNATVHHLRIYGAG